MCKYKFDISFACTSKSAVCYFIAKHNSLRYHFNSYKNNSAIVFKFSFHTWPFELLQCIARYYKNLMHFGSQ